MIFETPPAGQASQSDTAGEPHAPPVVWSEVDLHLHTTASDGRLTPQELVSLAISRELKVIALTDHDSTEGVEEGVETARGTELDVIAGVEINTDSVQGEAHVLGYFLDLHDAGLQACLQQRRRDRLERGLGIVRKLQDLGYDVNWDRVQELAGAVEGGAVGRPHVAQALLEKGYVSTTQEAFEHLIGRDGPAYVEYAKLTPEEAVLVIHDAGGIAVLAHPLFLREPEAFVASLAHAGLDGLECYYGNYTPDQITHLVAVARRFKLTPTGGSDFHGPEITSYNTTLGGTHVPMSVVADLRERHARVHTR